MNGSARGGGEGGGGGRGGGGGEEEPKQEGKRFHFFVWVIVLGILLAVVTVFTIQEKKSKVLEKKCTCILKVDRKRERKKTRLGFPNLPANDR
jgi:hypothetical protein